MGTALEKIPSRKGSLRDSKNSQCQMIPTETAEALRLSTSSLTEREFSGTENSSLGLCAACGYAGVFARKARTQSVCKRDHYAKKRSLQEPLASTWQAEIIRLNISIKSIIYRT